ncbi:MAG: STM4015 family protein [Deltaproteobacteria bacterium]|nr:STM4015 family protein [Deltaproteobacteria bacterium]
MTISDSTEVFGGKPVRAYDPAEGLTDAGSTAPRIHIDYDRHEDGQSAVDDLRQLAAHPDAHLVTALVVGDIGGTGEGNDFGPLVAALVEVKGALSGLTDLFIGDMIYEDCEISWINQTDVSPLYAAFPDLRQLRLRGGNGLSLGALEHARLETLIVETGGLDVQILRQVAQADLPELTHLELWLGDDGYGWNGAPSDVQAMLTSLRCPKLRYLGLRDSMIADEVAQVLATAPWPKGLRVLDLSLGTLGDVGIQALVDSGRLGGLEKLDIHHHYASPEAVARLGGLGIEVDASDVKAPDRWDDRDHRYVAVSE